MGRSNCILLVHRNFYWNTVCLKNVYTFSKTFSDIGRKNFGSLTKIFRQVCENCILRVYWNFSLENICLMTNLFLNFFADIEQKILTLLSEAFHWGHHKCILRFHQTNMSKYNFFNEETIFFMILGRWTKNVWPLKKFYSGGVVKTSFRLSKETF